MTRHRRPPACPMVALSEEDLDWFHDKFSSIELRLTTVEAAVLTRAAKKGRNNGAYAGLVVSIVPWIIYAIVALTGRAAPMQPPAAAPAPTHAVAP